MSEEKIQEIVKAKDYKDAEALTKEEINLIEGVLICGL